MSDTYVSSEKYHPILCNQENFLLHGNSYKVKQYLPNARVIFKEAVKEGMDGRPKNGMFVAIPDAIKELVTDVSPNYWRIQAILLQTVNGKTLVINSYFPNDPKNMEFDTSELLTTLSEIENVLNENEYDAVIWVGNINADFARNTLFTNTIETFVEEKSLLKSWDKFKVDFTHMFEREDSSYTSILDHFFWDNNTSEYILDAGVLHLPINTSDHCPIFCSVDTNIIATKERKPLKMKPKAMWMKANTEQKKNYTNTLQKKLSGLAVPESMKHCDDVHCRESCHLEDSDDLMVDILNSIKSASDSCIPSSKPISNNKKPLIPKWRDGILPFKDKALFWHSVWMWAGRPINTELHRIMKRTRNIYHLHIRKSKKMAETLKRNNLLNACVNNNCNIFQIIKRQRSASPTVSATIDGRVTAEVESHFAKTYKQLYNSVDDRPQLDEEFLA